MEQGYRAIQPAMQGGGRVQGSQTRSMSLVEAGANIVVGYWVAVASQVVFLPLWGITPSMRDNLTIGLLFSVISFVRGYALRRLFNMISLDQERLEAAEGVQWKGSIITSRG